MHTVLAKLPGLIGTGTLVLALAGGAIAEDIRGNLFSAADEAVKSANAARAHILAPDNYSKATGYYNSAEDKLARKKSLEGIISDLEKAVKHLRLAVSATRVAEVSLAAEIQARNDAESAEAEKYAAEEWQEAEQLLQRSRTETWLSRDSIGVLIPLSGRYQSYGELVKKGLELALQEHNKTRLPARFVYRDTAVEGVTSAQLVSGLTDDDKVIAVIGPLLGTAAGEAARRAQREMVPMVSFAQTEGLPEIGNFIFRDTLTAEQQVKRLVQYALGKGDISFSILYPENRLGEKMTELM